MQMVLGYRAPAICAWPWKRESLTVFVPAGRASNRYGNSRLRAEIWLWDDRPSPSLTRICRGFRRRISLAKTEEARELIQVGIDNVSAISRPFILPPRTPKERVQLLRKAFTATMNDPEFRADTEKSNLDLSPLSGAELEKTVHSLHKVSPALLARLKQIISPN